MNRLSSLQCGKCEFVTFPKDSKAVLAKVSCYRPRECSILRSRCGGREKVVSLRMEREESQIKRDYQHSSPLLHNKTEKKNPIISPTPSQNTKNSTTVISENSGPTQKKIGERRLDSNQRDTRSHIGQGEIQAPRRGLDTHRTSSLEPVNRCEFKRVCVWAFSRQRRSSDSATSLYLVGMEMLICIYEGGELCDVGLGLVGGGWL